MESIVKGMNRLAISQKYEVKSEVTHGYVPQPLVGIWARWPYFHNNSAPSLCAVLTASAKRPKGYWTGEPLDRERDFDRACNGYPSGGAVPEDWKSNPAAFYDPSRDGLSNSGHDEGIFLENGRELLSPEDKGDLIQFLQTL
jgi:hypothetical protein